MDRSFAQLDRHWPEPVWLEDVLFKAAISAVSLAQAGHAASVAGELKMICDRIVQRGWMHGGPAQYFDAQTARAALETLPEAQRAAAPSLTEVLERVDAAAPAKKRFWHR